MPEIPFAQFRFQGEIVNLTQEQFEQCLRDAKVCRCGDEETCLCCRVKAYFDKISYNFANGLRECVDEACRRLNGGS